MRLAAELATRAPVGRPRQACPHLLAKWVTKTRRSTATFADGRPRPDRLRGGRLVPMRGRCVRPVGHGDGHKTADGSTWS